MDDEIQSGEQRSEKHQDNQLHSEYIEKPTDNLNAEPADSEIDNKSGEIPAEPECETKSNIDKPEDQLSAFTANPAIRRQNQREFGKSIRFTPWRDINVESLGYDPRSSYVENYWLPFLGPSTIFLLRRVIETLQTQPHGFAIDINTLSAMLGLGENTGKNSSIQKTLNRILIFELGRIMPSGALSIRLKMPPLPQRYIDRLVPPLKTRLSAEVDSESNSPIGAIRSRARSLALSLANLGHDRLGIENQLLNWRFHPSVCYETLNWIDSIAPISSGKQGKQPPNNEN